MEDPASEQPGDDDVVIWHLPERDDLDVYRVTKGSRVIGECSNPDEVTLPRMKVVVVKKQPEQRCYEDPTRSGPSCAQ